LAGGDQSDPREGIDDAQPLERREA
jgi:hypothetical protein